MNVGFSIFLSAMQIKLLNPNFFPHKSTSLYANEICCNIYFTKFPNAVVDMAKFSRTVHALPLLWPLLTCVTIITPYIIAVSMDHVYPFLPSISSTASFQPEGSIFGFLMAIMAFFGLMAMFCRYLQLDGIRGDCEQNTSRRVKFFNKVSMPFGVSCFVGLMIVANCRSREVCQLIASRSLVR